MTLLQAVLDERWDRRPEALTAEQHRPTTDQHTDALIRRAVAVLAEAIREDRKR